MEVIPVNPARGVKLPKRAPRHNVYLTVEQLHALAASVRRLPTPRAKIRRIFIGIWGDIPAADHCFANALIEALAVAPASTEKPNDLLEQCEVFLEELLAESAPALPPNASMKEIQRRADEVLTEVEKFLLAECFAVEPKLNDGYA